MRSGLTFAALWAACIAGATALQHFLFGAPVDAAFLVLAACSSGLALGLMSRQVSKAFERAEAEALRDQQIAFLVMEAVRQRRALDRVGVAGLISKAEIEALESRSACRSDIRL